MMHKASSNMEKVPYCFSRSSIKFQGHTGPKIADFDLNWAFPDCHSSFNSPMALKWCTKLKKIKYRRGALYFFSEVIHQFQRSHGLKNHRLNPIWVRLLGRSQLSNPSDLPCFSWKYIWKCCWPWKGMFIPGIFTEIFVLSNSILNHQIFAFAKTAKLPCCMLNFIQTTLSEFNLK